MHPARATRTVQMVLALLAALFGLLTVFAGTRVLAGADPGYTVFRPLLIYNTVMGLVYVAAGFLIWRGVRPGLYAAAAVFLLNLLVLAAVAWLYTAGQGVALDSVRAMTLRTGVWLALGLGLAWLSRRRA
jgi:hypothetical protein